MTHVWIGILNLVHELQELLLGDTLGLATAEDSLHHPFHLLVWHGGGTVVGWRISLWWLYWFYHVFSAAAKHWRRQSDPPIPELQLLLGGMASIVHSRFHIDWLGSFEVFFEHMNREIFRFVQTCELLLLRRKDRAILRDVEIIIVNFLWVTEVDWIVCFVHNVTLVHFFRTWNKRFTRELYLSVGILTSNFQENLIPRTSQLLPPITSRTTIAPLWQ